MKKLRTADFDFKVEWLLPSSSLIQTSSACVEHVRQRSKDLIDGMIENAKRQGVASVTITMKSLHKWDEAEDGEF